MGVDPYHNFRSESEQAISGTSMGLADELLEDAS